MLFNRSQNENALSLICSTWWGIKILSIDDELNEYGPFIWSSESQRISKSCNSEQLWKAHQKICLMNGELFTVLIFLEAKKNVSNLSLFELVINFLNSAIHVALV